MSGLNLCNKDCTWADQKIIDLYPWDAGTDSGISYMVSTRMYHDGKSIYNLKKDNVKLNQPIKCFSILEYDTKSCRDVLQ